MRVRVLVLEEWFQKRYDRALVVVSHICISQVIQLFRTKDFTIFALAAIGETREHTASYQCINKELFISARGRAIKCQYSSV